MKEFLEKYELHNASIHVKYKTKAADNYRTNLDLLVSGGDLVKECDFEMGREILEKTRNDKETYFAFGSDDLVMKSRSNDGYFDGNLKKGKDAVFKIGNFLTNSMTNIVKKTSNLVVKKKDKNLQNSEIIQNSKEGQKGGFSLSGISSKLGNGIWSFGSKTKNLATSTTNFIKKTTNGFLTDKKDVEKDVVEEVDKSKVKYNDYFSSNSNEEEIEKKEEEKKEKVRKEYPVYQKQKVHQYQNFEQEDDDDVHFI